MSSHNHHPGPSGGPITAQTTEEDRRQKSSLLVATTIECRVIKSVKQVCLGKIIRPCIQSQALVAAFSRPFRSLILSRPVSLCYHAGTLRPALRPVSPSCLSGGSHEFTSNRNQLLAPLKCFLLSLPWQCIARSAELQQRPQIFP